MEDLGRHDPRQASVRAEESNPQYNTGEVRTPPGYVLSASMMYPTPTSTRPMKRPGSITFAQYRQPNRSMYSTAGMAPISNDPPPTRDMKTASLSPKPLVAEAVCLHQSLHVVHHCVDAPELSEEYYDICVNYRGVHEVQCRSPSRGTSLSGLSLRSRL